MMRRRRLSLVIALAGLALAAGCFKRSKSAQSYVLDPVEARGATAPAEAPRGVIGVLRVTVPGWIDRPQVAGRSPNGEVVTDDYSRWGEPFSRGVQRVLAENLAALLPDRRVVQAPFAPSIALDYRLDVTVTEAARQADGTVLVEARFGVIGARGITVVQRRSSHRVRPAAGAAASVAGLSEAIGGLSRDIAEALRSLPASAAAVKE
jgi:hypothetical protein